MQKTLIKLGDDGNFIYCIIYLAGQSITTVLTGDAEKFNYDSCTRWNPGIESEEFKKELKQAVLDIAENKKEEGFEEFGEDLGDKILAWARKIESQKKV